MDLYIDNHPSGLGFYIMPPRNCWFKIWRTPGPQEFHYLLDNKGNAVLDADGQPSEPTVVDIPVLYGHALHPRRYLDWDVPVEQDITYWLQVSDTEDGVYTEVKRVTLRAKPEYGYSAIDDSGIQDVINVRDALIVFLSTRLAYEARAGRVFVRQRGHRKKFNVVSEYEFNETDTPVVSVGYSNGAGQAADLGWTMTEEGAEFTIQAFSMDKQERDSLTSAFRGLIHDIDLFLSDMGCQETTFGRLQEIEQQADPMGYLLTLTIATNVYTQIAYINQDLWQMVPVRGWIGDESHDLIF